MAKRAVDWTPVSAGGSFMEQETKELVEFIRDRFPGLDMEVKRRSRSIREEPYVEHSFHIMVPRWQLVQARRVIKAALFDIR